MSSTRPPSGSTPGPPWKSGDEPILDAEGRVTGTLLGFWRWSSSELLDNALRGMLAEYLVGLALNCTEHTGRREWDAHDLVTADGILIEVKSSAHLQSWCREKPSTISFGVSETRGWHADTDTYEETAARSAHVYVFCVFTERDRDRANPLDTRQWSFLVAPTRRINEVLGGQKSITLGSLRSRLNPAEVDFGQLAEAVRAAAEEN